MGWFDEQLRRRIESDDEQFESAFASMASIVMDDKELHLKDEVAASDDAVKQVLAHYRIHARSVPEDITDAFDRLEYLLRPAGIMWRNVTLKPGWSKNAIGPLLVQNGCGGVSALIPRASSGYWIVDGGRRALSSRMEKELGSHAICFYKPLPLKKLDVRDLLKYAFGTLSVGDAARIVVSTFCVTLVGLVLPYVNKLLFSTVVPSGSVQLIIPIALLLAGATISSTLFAIDRALVLDRLVGKLRLMVRSATMMRLLGLPLSFYRSHSAGELLSRMDHVSNASKLIFDTLLTTSLTALFSLVYIAQISSFAPSLTLPALFVIAVSAAYSVISVFAMTPWQKKSLDLSAQADGVTYALIAGIQKLKLTGSERRAFARWAEAYTQAARVRYRPPWYVRADKGIYCAITLLGSIILYYFAGSSGVNTADYMAFAASYGLVSGAFASFATILRNIAEIRPSLEMAAPLLETVPEIDENRRMISHLMGGIELNGVSFRYDEDGPYLLDDLSLKIRSGQYVAIVGKTGCGKSTLIRMLLGFETPERGAVYYDGLDIATMDLSSLRQKIGTVTQNGKLFEGTVFSNIAICTPGLTLEAAWRVAEMAGLADDIRAMPLGMGTFVSEGGGGFSGGQRQRLMIARAIAPNPRVLIFDEATSALDNITQRQVSKALDALKCTRIVVAHRLSTICQCDRIVLLDKGKIVEDGSFDELMSRQGAFADLVSRQMTETPLCGCKTSERLRN